MCGCSSANGVPCAGCEGKKPCKKCREKSNNADGSTNSANYDPIVIGKLLNQFVMGNKDITTQPVIDALKEAYPKAMLYMEKNNIVPSEETIKANSDKIAAAIADPDYIKNNTDSETGDVKKQKSYMGLAILVLGCLAVIYLINKQA